MIKIMSLDQTKEVLNTVYTSINGKVDKKSYFYLPFQIGYWVDDTPIYRVTFEEEPFVTNNTNSDGTHEHITRGLIPATNFDYVRLIEFAISYGTNPKSIKTSALIAQNTSEAKLNSDGTFSIVDSNEGTTDKLVSGYIDFSVSEDYLKPQVDGGTATTVDNTSISGGTALSEDAEEYSGGSSIT